MTAVSDTGGTIRFELETPAPAAVEVVREGTAGTRDAAPAGKSVFESREASSLHAVVVTGLEPSTPYSYVVRAARTVLADGRFATAPRPNSGAAVTFLVYGDNRSDDDAHAAVVRAMMQVPSDFVVQTGDMVSDGGSAQNWQRFFDIEKAMLRERPLLAAIGNHELYDDASGGNFARYFGFSGAPGGPRPYGTARFGDVRFFFLNGMDGWSSGEERSWLERELARADDEAGLVWRFAVVHQSPWSAGPHGPNVQMVEGHVPELLAAHKIDLLFAGHDHLYERGDAGPIKYLISGGGGAPLYRDIHVTATTRRVEAVHHFIEVTAGADAIRIVAHRRDGSILERCGLPKGGPWDCDARDADAPANATPATVGAGDAAGPPAREPGGGQPSAQPSATRCLCDAPGSAPGRGVCLAALSIVSVLAASRRARRTRRRRGEGEEHGIVRRS